MTDSSDNNIENSSANNYNNEFNSLFNGTVLDNNNNNNSGSSSTNMEDQITPNILLEQLAFVDNFMTNIDQDFKDLDSWILNNTSSSANNNNNNNTVAASTFDNTEHTDNNYSYLLDEQLATELSAFTDNVFIFPDEDKPKDNNNNNNNNNIDNIDNIHNIHNNDNHRNIRQNKNKHYLSQRKNTFLTSQYDHSKSRFSSRRNNNNNNYNNNNLPNSNNNSNEFNNVEISTFTPDDSQISNLNNVTTPQIQMPDYSQISTESLVALLPRVTIPSSINSLLINAGFSHDQIIALSAIMAHHEQQRKTRNTESSPLSSQLNKLNDNNPIKPTVLALSKLIDSIELQNKVKSSMKNNNNPSNNNKDEILSLIEAGNKEVNELKDKLDKKINRTQKLKEEMNNLKNDEYSTTTTTSSSSSSSSNKRSFMEMENDEVVTDQKDNKTKIKTKTKTKKKLKEKELENSIQQLKSLASSLENKIDTLQLENKLLKDLVVNSTESNEDTEKNDNNK